MGLAPGRGLRRSGRGRHGFELVETRPMPANNLMLLFANDGVKLKLYSLCAMVRAMDESSMTQNRRSRRSPVSLAATIEVDGVPQPVKLRNLSEEGALIEGERLPPEGSTTFFERNELRLKSRVVWVQGRYAGVAFARPLRQEEVLRHVPQPRHRSRATSAVRVSPAVR